MAFQGCGGQREEFEAEYGEVSYGLEYGARSEVENAVSEFGEETGIDTVGQVTVFDANYG